MIRRLAALALFVLPMVAADRYGAPFNPKADPRKDLETARALAARSARRVLLEVGGEWCGWCLRFEELVHGNVEVRSVLERYYVLVKVNWSKENRNEAFLAGYPKVTGYPHFFVLDSSGKVLFSQSTMALESRNNYDPQKVKVFLLQYGQK